MSENLALALQITLVGMGIVFAAIILLGLVMEGLVRLTAQQPDTVREDGETAEMSSSASAAESDRRRRAAAVAVAVALAQQADRSQPHAFPLPPTALVSAWQAVMRTRILNKRGPTR